MLKFSRHFHTGPKTAEPTPHVIIVKTQFLRRRSERTGRQVDCVEFFRRRYEVEDAHASDHTSVIYRPVIPVSFIGDLAAIRFRGLLDTGADERF